MQVASVSFRPNAHAKMALLEGLLQRTLADSRALTQHPSAGGARFRLLALALAHASRARVRTLGTFCDAGTVVTR